MAAPVTCSHEVPAAVPAAFEALTSERWPVALDARLRDGSELVERTELPDGGLRLVTQRRLPEGIPSFLRRFAPADGKVTQTDVWGPERDGIRTGTWSVALTSAPGSVGGSMTLAPSGAGARWTVDGAVVLKVPLVGGKAESFLAPLVEKLVGTQAEVLRGMLG